MNMAAFLLKLVLTTFLILNITNIIDGRSRNSKSKIRKGKNLLVISLDGFRYDFLDIAGTTTLNTLASRGVRAKSLTSSYVTKTFPNHYSIATGLYEESHGIVTNTMWDPLWEELFFSCTDPECGKWYGGEPIWNSNELANQRAPGSSRQRRGSGVVYWPGASAEINNMNITFSEKYVDPYSNDSSYLNLRQRFDKAISWFTDEETPVNLAMVYYEFPDKLGHIYGPESAEVNNSVRQIDTDFRYLLDRLHQKDLYDTTNMLIVSDHGFADINGQVYLDDCIKNISEYIVINNSPIVGIWPTNEGSDLEYLIRTLEECGDYVVHRNPSPQLQQYHYSSNRRIAPILLSTPFSPEGSSAKLIITSQAANWTNKGSHGWNNSWDRMHALFIAHGPAFHTGMIHPSFVNVNIYPLMCALLSISCPPSNGSIDAVKDMLRFELPADEGAVFCTKVWGYYILIVCAVVVAAILNYCLYHSFKSHTSDRLKGENSKNTKYDTEYHVKYDTEYHIKYDTEHHVKYDTEHHVKYDTEYHVKYDTEHHVKYDEEHKVYL